jgi:gas vesicle protein
MSDAKEHVEAAGAGRTHAGHPVAFALISGAALGAGLGLLFAPRRGSEVRKEIGGRMHEAGSAASHGYHRAKDTAAVWAHHGRSAFSTTCSKVARGAHETQRYVREVADAVTLKTRRDDTTEAADARKMVQVGAAAVPLDQPVRIETANSLPRRRSV